MPITSKRIISFIRNLSEPFTNHYVARELLCSTSVKNSKPTKKKKKLKTSQQESIEKIDVVLKALVSIGYLERRKRKSYIRCPHFKLEGPIKVNSSGNGILETREGDAIIIKKEFINHAHNNDYVEADIIDYRNGTYLGNINKIIRRGREEYIAKIDRTNNKYIYYKLIDTPGAMEVYSKRLKEEVESGVYSIVRLKDRYLPGIQECHIEEFLFHTEECDFNRIKIKHSLPEVHKNYKELKKNIGNISKKEIPNRKDFRDLLTVTIDGENAKDFDDAISLERSYNEYKLYVHIADVSTFVKKGSELDKEALDRGNSYYLGNYVIPMLPEILSNNLCSLKEGEERFAMSAVITFDNKGNEIGSSFHRSIVKVNKRLTYNKANDIILQERKTKIGKTLMDMYELAVILKTNRLSKGRIDLNLPEAELIYDAGTLSDIEFMKRMKSHTIIEEFMLTANEVVSRVLKSNNTPSLYRIHENIDNKNVLALKKFLRSLGLNLQKRENIGIAIQSIIEKVAGKEYEHVVNFIILKSFMQAYYGTEPLGHFGLGFRDYTHFTSPIRRYPDLVVHRCLKSIIDKSPPPYTLSELKDIGEKSSKMERVAQSAERDLFKLKACRLIKDRIGDNFKAIISSITKSGFFVTLVDKPIEGMVPLRFLTDDYYIISEDEFAVVGRRGGKRFILGDILNVRLISVDVDSMRIDFDVL